jgi:hypothetical protein
LNASFKKDNYKVTQVYFSHLEIFVANAKQKNSNDGTQTFTF